MRYLCEIMADFGPKSKWVELSQEDLRKDPKLVDDFVDMIASSYAKIGGHLEFRSPASFFGGDVLIFDAIDFDADPEPDIVMISKRTPFGKKGVASATDGSRDAKQRFFAKKVDELGKPGMYGEVSDAMAHLLIKRGHVKYVASQEEVERVLGKKVEWVGEIPQYPGYDGWYRRKIAGEEHMKIMVGMPVGVPVQ